MHDIYQTLAQVYTLNAVFLDILETFHEVCHKGLIHNLKQNGIGEPLLKILTDFLKLQKQRVVETGQRIPAQIPGEFLA